MRIAEPCWVGLLVIAGCALPNDTQQIHVTVVNDTRDVVVLSDPAGGAASKPLRPTQTWQHLMEPGPAGLVAVETDSSARTCLYFRIPDRSKAPVRLLVSSRGACRD